MPTLKLLVLCLLSFSFHTLVAQTYKVHLLIKNEQLEPTEDANVNLGVGKNQQTNSSGLVSFVCSKQCLIDITHSSYLPLYIELHLFSDTTISILLQVKSVELKPVTISSSHSKGEGLKRMRVNNVQLTELQGNTLMSRLKNLPGIASIDIGQGFSKPVIRGLYANRVAVIENGIKQQGQQWGMDHGLEIDPNAIEDILIIKGPSSLRYGSAAIGGVIVLSPQIRTNEGIDGSVLLNSQSNNNLLGSSVSTSYKKGDYFLRSQFSYQSYADYHVPAKSFDYLGYTLPIQNERLKNTAGRDKSLLFSVGWRRKKIETQTSLSNVYAKMGFFPGAHGIPGKNSLEQDQSSRNIDLPYQSVNHFKLINNTKLFSSEKEFWSTDFRYQLNHRQEYATPHSHGSAPLPQSSLELDLLLRTLSGNLDWKRYFSEKAQLTAGLSTEFQENRIGGYSFLLPSFIQRTAGFYTLIQLNLKKEVFVEAGLRIDYGEIQIDEYKDQYLLEGFQRAIHLNRHFNELSYTLGGSFLLPFSILVKPNIGKSFRMPNANELSSNGIHHGTFRYELGNPNLQAETAYQGDLTLQWNNKTISVSLSSFVTYFMNFIYLDPTGKYSIKLPDGTSVLLPDVGQIYQYTQGSTIRWGGESEISLQLSEQILLRSSVEYVHATDIEHNYPIPFTPPLSMASQIEWEHPDLCRLLTKARLSLSHRYTAAQNRVRNEDRTPLSNVFSIMYINHLKIGNNRGPKIIFGINNLFNTRYYNHISFYRNLGLPEIGRNISLSLLFTLNKQEK